MTDKVTEYGFDQASLARPKDCADEFTGGEIWEGEVRLGKIATYFYTFNVDLWVGIGHQFLEQLLLTSAFLGGQFVS